MKADDFNLISISRRYGRLVRGVAVFFLLFTGADILLPEYFCDDEIGGISLSAAATMLASLESASERGHTAFVDSNNSHSRQPSDTTPHAEDCFCCCAHVLPGIAFATVNVSELRSPFAPEISQSLPSPPLRGSYHPPRIA